MARVEARGVTHEAGGDARMEEHPDRTSLLSALTTEHFVLQTANNSTYAEASARSTLYVMALSSTVVAMGFVASSTDLFIPFAAVSLPVVFFLGVVTVVRLVESALESMQYLTGIARIRGYYRTLGPEAAHYFAPRYGRWPEVEAPALRFGPTLAFFGTTATMIAAINNVVGGVGLALLTRTLSPSAPSWVSALAGVAGALVLTWLFYVYQRWRFDDFEARTRERAEDEGGAL
jgi:hypothetical protein